MCFLNENIIFKHHTNVKPKPNVILKAHGDSVSLVTRVAQSIPLKAVNTLLLRDVLPMTSFSFCFKVLT